MSIIKHEPIDGIAGYSVVKNSWRGSYKRYMSITNHDITTYNPKSLEITNRWTYDEVAGVSINIKSTDPELILCVPKSKGKSPGNMFFQSPHTIKIVTNILSQYRKFKHFSESMHKIFDGYKVNLSREQIRVKIYCTPAGIEIFSPTTNRCIAYYFYTDIEVVHPILDISGGVIIVTKFDKRMHALGCTQYQNFIKCFIALSKENLNINITVETGINFYQYCDLRLGTFHDDSSLIALSSFQVQKVTPRSSQPVSRTLCLSEVALIEHESSTYHIVSIRSLKRIYSFYRSPSNTLEFAIEWIDGWPRASFYLSTERDSLLATILNAVRGAGNEDAHVHSSITDFSRRLDPPSTFVCEDTEILCLRALVNDTVKMENVNRFNINIPYSGFKHAHTPDYIFGEKKEKSIQNAIIYFCQLDSLLPTINAIDCESIFMALRRLLSSKSGFDSFSTLPRMFEKIGQLIVAGLRLKEDCVTYAAIEAMNALLVPLHPNSDIYSEQQNKLSIFGDIKFTKILLRLITLENVNTTSALVISVLLDFITFAVCPPFSDTTDSEKFKDIVQTVSDLGPSLFKLFLHSSPYIVKSIGMIVKAIIEESTDEIRLRIQNLALSEGVFPLHLYTALFSQPTLINTSNAYLIVNRQLCRNLIKYWCHSNELAHMLLIRAMPLGLVNYLKSSEEAGKCGTEFLKERTAIELDVKNKKVVDVFVQESIVKAEAFLNHWYSHLAERVGAPVSKRETPKNVIIRERAIDIVVNENWDLFYEKFYQDIYLPDLIWNHTTRQELKNCLEGEIRAFGVDKELGSAFRIGWNFEDFQVTYASLKDEIMIGDFYLKPVLDKEDFTLSDPKVFFIDLYHKFLQSHSDEMKYSCIKAMTKIYSKCHDKIGKFPDISYLFHLLTNSDVKLERDLMLMLFKQLSLNRENARKMIGLDVMAYFVDLATLAHLHTTRATVPLQTLMLEGSYMQKPTSHKEWYIEKENEQTCFSIEDIREKMLSLQISSDTKVWCTGMAGWQPIREISQLKWTVLDTSTGIFNESEMALVILDILNNVSSLFASVNSEGAIIRPLPRVKRLLSDIRSLPHLCQLLLTFDPPIVEKTSRLLNDIMLENPIVSHLYISGCYFFMLMYTGCNVSPIAKLLKDTHLKQSFYNEDQKSNKKYTNSILSSLLPEALIACLTCYDHLEFAKLFLSEYNTPEIIWSNEMRRYMMEKIAVHLAEFTPRLKSNVKSMYLFCPIPRIEYEILSKELFCGRYYLRNLCNTDKFPNWPISDPFNTLKDILEAWRDEVNKKPPEMSLDDAYVTLQLETGVIHSDAVVRRTYLSLATKYHPDKNPDGGDIFEKMIKAYEFICSHSISDFSPSISNIILLLKSQSILFVNYKKELEPYKYSGYPMLIKTILLEVDDDNLFSKTNDEVLLLPAVELAHNTISCSGLNAEELRYNNGIEALAKVFDRCIALINASSMSTDLNVIIIENVIRCFIASCRFQGFLDLILDIPAILLNFSHILMYHDTLASLCCTTAECLVSMCSSNIVQMKILDTCLLYHLVYFLFLYDYTLIESGLDVSHESNIQQKMNELSSLSMQCLAIMSASSFEDKNNFPINKILICLLTEYVVKTMVSKSHKELLKTLTSNISTPYLKWNNQTRTQLKQLLQTIRKYDPEMQYEYHNRVQNFKYDDHANELIIGAIYIDIFNNNPTFPIESPQTDVINCLDYIRTNASYVYSLISTGQYHPSYKNRVDNILSVTQAVCNLIAQGSCNQTIDKTHYVLLLSMFTYTQFKEVQKIVIKIVSILVTDQKCVLCIAEARVINYLNLATKFISDDLHLVINIFHSLLSNSKLVKEAIDRGTLIYLLDIFCQSKDIEVRTNIVELFARCIHDKVVGQRVSILIKKFLPSIFVDAFLDNPHASVLLFENQQENPELVWNDDIRKHVSGTINQHAAEFSENQLKDPDIMWIVPNDFSIITQSDSSLYIEEVNIERFIVQPTWVLRHPKQFLIGLMEALQKIYQTYNDSQGETLEQLTTASCLLLEAQPNLCDQMPNFGYIPKMITQLNISEVNCPIVNSILRIFCLYSKNKLCTIEIARSNIWLSAFVGAFEKRPDCALINSEILNWLFNHEIASIAAQVLNSEYLSKIVKLLELPLSEVDSPSSVRAHIVNGLQALQRDSISGQTITQVLDSHTIWKQFKNQKHDLFIDTSTTNLRITSSAAGVAGYLTAAYNTASTSFANTNSIKMLTNQLPPNSNKPPK